MSEGSAQLVAASGIDHRCAICWPEQSCEAGAFITGNCLCGLRTGLVQLLPNLIRCSRVEILRNRGDASAASANFELAIQVSRLTPDGRRSAPLCRILLLSQDVERDGERASYRVCLTARKWRMSSWRDIEGAPRESMLSRDGEEAPSGADQILARMRRPHSSASHRAARIADGT
jgi:hypothetical protein